LNIHFKVYKKLHNIQSQNILEKNKEFFAQVLLTRVDNQTKKGRGLDLASSRSDKLGFRPGGF